MYRYRTMFLAAVLTAVLAACGDDPPAVADPEDLELEIVSGDGQVAMVSIDGTGPAADLAPAQTVPDDVLPEPLIARITIDGGEPSASIAGPRLDVLPANTSVSYAMSDDRCGRPFVASAIPDDSGYVTNYWERGTLAGACTMEVRLILDGAPVVDTLFSATFEPGPVVFNYFRVVGWSSSGMSPYSEPCYIRDEHGNAIAYTLDIPAFAHWDAGAIVADSIGRTGAIVLVAGDSVGSAVVEVYDVNPGLGVVLESGTDADLVSSTVFGVSSCNVPS